MSFHISDQFAAAHKNSLTNLAKVSTAALEGIQKLAELSLQEAKSSLAEGQANLMAVAAGKDLRDVWAVQGHVSHVAADRAITYARDVCEIASQTQAKMAKVAEEQYAQHQRNLQVFIDTYFLKNAPAGSEAIAAMLHSTLDTANQSYRSAQTISQQLADLAYANLTAAGAPASSAGKAPRRSSQA